MEMGIDDYSLTEPHMVGSSLQNRLRQNVGHNLMSGSRRVAIGAPTEDEHSEWGDGGSVRIFEWTGGEWIQVGSEIEGLRPFDASVCSLNADGSRVAIGSCADSVRAFEYDGEDWRQMGRELKVPGVKAASGSLCAINNSGTRVAVGSKIEGDEDQVTVFEWDSETWRQVGETITGYFGFYCQEGSTSLDLNGVRLW